MPLKKERKHTKKKEKNLDDRMDSLDLDTASTTITPSTIESTPPRMQSDEPIAPRNLAKKANLDDRMDSLDLDTASAAATPPSVEPTPPLAKPDESVIPPVIDSPPVPLVLPSPESSLKPSPTLETTLFSRLLALHGPSIRRMLKIQYRMNSKIMAFASAALYDGDLVADSSVEDRLLSDLPGVEVDEEIDQPLIFIDSQFFPCSIAVCTDACD